MNNYTLSNKAQSDLERIYQYTEQKFGANRAESYLLSLHDCLLLLADKPKLAQDVRGIRSGYFRYLCQKHSIFFKVRDNDIYIVRVLHQQMKFELHLTS